MNPKDHSPIDPDDRENNESANPHFDQLLSQRLHRRHLLRGGVSAMAVVGLGPMALAGCGGNDGGVTAAPALGPAPASAAPAPSPAVAAPAAIALGFTAVAKDLADRLVVADGYTATVIYATGDSLDPAVGDYRNDGTDANFARRAGDHHDAIEYFGLNAAGTARDAGNTDRALLAMNHENIAGTAPGIPDDSLASGEKALPLPPTDEDVEDAEKALGAPQREVDSLPLDGE